MRDGFDGAGAGSRRGLSYPFDSGPEIGGAVDVAPGVKWLRLPLGGSLQFINVWAVEDGPTDGERGWAIFDTGIGGPETLQAWRKAFAGPLAGKTVSRVFVTHMHPDHTGMAGWLTRKFACRLWITRLEFLTCRSLAADTGLEAPDEALAFYRTAGWDETAIENYRSRFGFFGKSLHVLPNSFRRLNDRDRFMVGDHEWEVVVGSGHSPEHACFYCPGLKLMISGDQVLPRISSNVSVFPTEPDADPLRDWLTSLARIKTRIPDDVLVLPAHNDPFHGLHARLDQLIDGHERILKRLRRQIAEPKRSIDVFGTLFGRAIDDSVLGMATGESIAHLNCLLGRGQAVRTRDAVGVTWYQAA